MAIDSSGRSKILFMAFFLATTICPAQAWTFTVPDTGVTACYDGDGNQIVCPEAGQPYFGQDAHYGPGAMILQANGDGTVTDTNTGLVWEVKGGSDGLADPANPNDPDNTYSFAELADFIIQLNTTHYAGNADWRLPTVKELETIIDLSVAEPGPTILTDFFPNCQSGSYWTSIPDSENSSHAWAIDFSTSIDNIALTSEKFHIRAVRGGM